MGLGLQTTSTDAGDILPRCQYDAKAGRLFKIERVQDRDGAWVSNPIDITFDKPTFIMDFGHIEVGHIAFIGGRPDFHMVPLGSPLPPSPSKDHKQGFRIRLYGQKHLDGVREISGSSKAILGQIDDLHTQYEKAPEAAVGKVPVVQFTGTTPVTTGAGAKKSTNYVPNFVITQWTDRPEELGERIVPMPGAPATQRAAEPTPQPASRHVPPPTAPVAAPAQTYSDEVPF